MAKVLEYNATLVERLDFSSGLATFKIRPDEAIEDPKWFVPGQYMVLGLNNEEKPELGSVRRPMSIASPPQQRDTIDFYIRYVNHPDSNNPLTHLLWKIEEGARVYVRAKPTGHFTVEHTIGDDDPRLKILVAAGTGLAPFTSMVFAKVIDDPNVRLDDFAILHAASYSEEIGYQPELERLAAENGLKYLPSISRPKERPDWKGHAGRVEDFFKPERLDGLEKDLGMNPGELKPQNAVIFICGLTGTIGMTLTRLLHRGFVADNRRVRKAFEIPEETKSSLFYEQYDTTPPIDLKDPEEVARLKAIYDAAQ